MNKKLAMIAQVGLFFMSLFGGFFTLVAPPGNDGKFWTPMATIIAGCAFLFVRLESQSLEPSTKERKLRRLALAAIMVSMLSFGYYRWLTETRTAQYNHRAVVIGTQLTDRGRLFKEGHPLDTNSDLLTKTAGNPLAIWTESSVQESRMLLGVFYAFSVGLLALGLISGCEVLKAP
jgi:hypothetical protein